MIKMHALTCSFINIFTLYEFCPFALFDWEVRFVIGRPTVMTSEVVSPAFIQSTFGLVP